MRLSSLRVTEIGLALRCPLQLWHLKTVGARPPGVSRFIGKCFHKAVEKSLRYKADKQVPMAKGDIFGSFELEWDLGKDAVIDWEDMSKDQAKDRGIELVGVYNEERIPSLVPAVRNEQVLVEYPVQFNVKNPDGDLQVTGTVDLITRDKKVIDHKTASRKWAEQDAEKEVQPHLYRFGLDILKFDVEEFNFSVAWKTKREVGTQVLPVGYDKRIALAYLGYALRIKKMFETENPLPVTEGWHCSPKWCGWYSICEFGSKLKVFI